MHKDTLFLRNHAEVIKFVKKKSCPGKKGAALQFALHPMETLYFSLHRIFPVVWYCMGAVAVALAWLLIFYRERLAKVKPTGEAADSPAQWPGVSVIVYTQETSQQLARMLPSVLSQDYPSEFEVVVVNDGSSRDVTDVVNYLSNTHQNLHITFVPYEAHNLSRKKLGISLGIKAAKYPYVLITTALADIPSNAWLRLMAEPLARGKKVVLGTSKIADLKGAMNRFDALEAQTVWLSGALAGHPYRGTSYNIGYATELFFENKGFSRSLTLHHGDDDMFISEIATPENTQAVVGEATNLVINRYQPAKALRDLRMQHCFTGRYISKTSSRLFGLSTIMLWVWLVASVTGMVMSIPNLLPTCFFLSAAAGLWIPLAMVWKKTARAQQISMNLWLLPWLLMWRWTRTLSYRIHCGRASRRNYTWIQR